jgi:hypothetical protein
MGEEDSEGEELRKTRVGPKIPIGSLHLPLFEIDGSINRRAKSIEWRGVVSQEPALDRGG